MKAMKIQILIMGVSASLFFLTGCAAFDQALTQPYQQPAYYPQTITPNAYGLGVNANQYGQPQTYRTQDGQQLAPIFQGGVQQNAYGLGVGMDQFGRPVYSSPP
jgi:hypothetical protein